MDEVLRTKELTKFYGSNRALHAASVSFDRRSVHVFAGENGSGKSTLLKLIAGTVDATSGEVLGPDGPLAAGRRSRRDAGIEFISQEGSLVPSLSVAENISLGRRLGSSTWRPDWSAQREIAFAALERLELEIDPDRLVASLSRGEQQLVEVARGLAADADLLLLDEATSSLGPARVASLLTAVRRFAELGGAVGFVTHRVPELFAIGHDVTVLRDGEIVASGSLDEFDERRLVESMVGRPVTKTDRLKTGVRGEIRLRVEAVVECPGGIGPVSMHVGDGEIVGLAGLVGAGRTELLETLMGVRRRASGSVTVSGQPVPAKPRAAIDAGMVLVTEDRRRSGVVPDFGVLDNLALAQRGRQFASPADSRKRVRRWISELGVKSTHDDASILSLSGGNQQKVLIGRAVACAPRVLLLDEPTRGVDVGAKEELYGVIRALAASGVAIVAVSSELPELLAICDRILVMREGCIVGEVGPDTSEAEIISLAAGIGSAT